MTGQYIIVHADKSVLQISGIKVDRLNIRGLEEMLAQKLQTMVRVIGVTGDGIEMDVYDMEPEMIRRNKDQLVEAVALAEGITATDLLQMVCSEKIIKVDYADIPDQPRSGCAKERWLTL